MAYFILDVVCLSRFNFEAGLSASVNRGLDYHMGRETSIDMPLSLQLFTVVWL